MLVVGQAGDRAIGFTVHPTRAEVSVDFLYTDKGWKALDRAALPSGVDALDGEWHETKVIFDDSGAVDLFIDGNLALKSEGLCGLTRSGRIGFWGLRLAFGIRDYMVVPPED